MNNYYASLRFVGRHCEGISLSGFLDYLVEPDSLWFAHFRGAVALDPVDGVITQRVEACSTASKRYMLAYTDTHLSFW